MSDSHHQQYAFRAQKQFGVCGGLPEYAPIDSFEKPEGVTRIYHYSQDGRYFAHASPSGIVILLADELKPVTTLDVTNAIELSFSPKGTFISTWERPVRLEDGAQHKNMRVFSVATGEELISLTQKAMEGWALQFTASESHAIRLVSHEIQVFDPSDWSRGVVDKLKVEGCTGVSLSPGTSPSIAVFVPEKGGAPATIRIYRLQFLSAQATCSKSFYKADRTQIKWNDTGSHVLFLTQTDVDNSNKSYYGETGLYLLSAAGDFDCRVTLDKEGPIHDFTWSPNSKEFGVVYGYMPAKSVLFDRRTKVVHEFGSQPHNFISFNPQGRLLALAGFGNLAGKITIIDRRTLQTVCSIDAPNTSVCEWSPDGRFLLTATLSPRLRVDNGIKIWHFSGGLMHVHLVEELYQASWRPARVDSVPPFPPNSLPAAPQPASSVQSHLASNPPAPAKPAGAYRPPGARGGATPMIYRREDEGGVPSRPQTANGNNSSYSDRPGAGGSRHRQEQSNGMNGASGQRRYVPGAAPPQPSSSSSQQANGGEEKKPRRKKGDKEKGGGESSSKDKRRGDESVRASMDVSRASPPEPASEPQTGDWVKPDGESAPLDPLAKKIRNMNKKLKAIEELKEKAKRGDKLELTQKKKMDGEAELRKELAVLMEQAAAAGITIAPATT